MVGTPKQEQQLKASFYRAFFVSTCFHLSMVVVLFVVGKVVGNHLQ
jgi:hypothetical protein